MALMAIFVALLGLNVPNRFDCEAWFRSLSVRKHSHSVKSQRSKLVTLKIFMWLSVNTASLLILLRLYVGILCDEDSIN
jgi:hypothetical protein